MRANASAAPKQRIRTMEEFSAVSGISRPTLSRFFNDPLSVRPTSRARIEEAMERYGYRPNLFAVNSNRRNPKTLGIVIPSLMDPFYAGIVQALERQASDAGYWTIIQNSQGSADREAEAMATLLSLNVAGIIAIPLGDASRRGLFRDAARSVPIVFVDTQPEADGSFVGTDNAQSMRLVVDYLLRSGSPPAYFDMPEVNQNARERRNGYADAMKRNGFEPTIHRVRSKGWDFEQAAFEAASDLFRSAALTKGTVLCANDRIAFGVMAAATQAGLSIGRAADLRIAGHDDHPLSRFACPSLTTVAQDGDAIGSKSLSTILDTIAGQHRLVTTDRIEARLIMRDSA